jgi:hypothetical protein
MAVIFFQAAAHIDRIVDQCPEEVASDVSNVRGQWRSNEIEEKLLIEVFHAGFVVDLEADDRANEPPMLGEDFRGRSDRVAVVAEDFPKP